MKDILTIESMEKSARRGADWLKDSAQLTDPKDPSFGALQSDYDMTTKKWSFFEPFWHTAQAVRAWLGLQKTLRCNDWSESIALAVQYLNGQIIDQPDNPRFHGGHLRYDKERAGLLATTTVTNGLEGLIDYYVYSGDASCLKTLKRSAYWLNEVAYDRHTGFIHSFMDSGSGQFVEHSAYHPGTPEFLGKRPEVEGSALLFLGKIFNRSEWFSRFERILDYLVEDQSDDGIWWNWRCNQQSPALAHGRYNLWIAFAMLNGFEFFGKQEYKQAALKTALFYRKAQQLDGVISYRTAPDSRGDMHTPCGSAIAMAALLWLRLSAYEYNQDFAEGVKLSLLFLFNTQYNDNFFDENLHGAFFESKRMTPYSGFSFSLIRDIATIFALQLISQVIFALRKNNWTSLDEWIESAQSFTWQSWPAEKMLLKKPALQHAN